MSRAKRRAKAEPNPVTGPKGIVKGSNIVSEAGLKPEKESRGIQIDLNY